MGLFLILRWVLIGNEKGNSCYGKKFGGSDSTAWTSQRASCSFLSSKDSGSATQTLYQKRQSLRARSIWATRLASSELRARQTRQYWPSCYWEATLSGAVSAMFSFYIPLGAILSHSDAVILCWISFILYQRRYCFPANQIINGAAIRNMT